MNNHFVNVRWTRSQINSYVREIARNQQGQQASPNVRAAWHTLYSMQEAGDGFHLDEKRVGKETKLDAAERLDRLPNLLSLAARLAKISRYQDAGYENDDTTF